MREEKITLTLPSELLEAVEKKAKRKRKKRDEFLKEVIAFYIALEDRKTRIKKELIKGYKESSEASMLLSREFFEIEQEIFKDIFKYLK
ncbi:MAG: hypothetical protein DRI28_00725 [Caldiserica bacterium]|nr:MAG: hypothetical protein DRI28_00725 [Caldisericota bacterium]